MSLAELSSAPAPAEGTTRGNRLLSSTAVSAASALLVTGVAVAVTPVLLGGLGTEAYGVWVLVMTFTVGSGMAGLADLGLLPSYTREIARCPERTNALVCSAVRTMTALGVGAGLVLALGSPGLIRVIHQDPEAQADLRTALLLVAVQLPVELATAGLYTFFEGRRDYVRLRVLETGSKLVLMLATTVAVAAAGISVVGLAACGVLVSAVTFLTALCLARTRGLRWSRQPVDKPWVLARLSFLLRVHSTVFRHSDRLIVAVVLTSGALAPYDVAAKLGAVTVLAAALAPSAVLPYVAARTWPGAELLRLCVGGTAAAVALTLCVVAPLLVRTHELLSSWVGPHVAGQAAATAQLALVAPLVALVPAIGVQVLLARHELRGLGAVHALGLGVKLVATPVLCVLLGLPGAVIATLVAGLVTVPLLLQRVAASLGLPAWQLAAGLVREGGPAVLAVLGLSVALAGLLGPLSLFLAVAGPANLLAVGLLCPPVRAQLAALSRQGSLRTSR